MALDLGGIRIDAVIIHDVPQPVKIAIEAPNDAQSGKRSSRKREKLDESIVGLSGIESPTNTVQRNYFGERMVQSLGIRNYPVEFDDSHAVKIRGEEAEEGGTAPTSETAIDGVGYTMSELVCDCLGARTVGLVQASQMMARHLYRSQTRVNPAGLLAVVIGTHNGAPCLGIIKLEREGGIRVHGIERDGKSTFEIEFIGDLMLTKNTRVFKIGLFVQTGDTMESIEGYVSDTQQEIMSGVGVAGFFLRYLGCKLRAAPDELSKQYFDTAEKFINERVPDPDTKARYHVALLAQMSDQTDVVRADDFARQHLALEDRNAFRTYLTDAEIPTTEFPKDISRIETRLRRMRLDFESGLAILGPPEEFDRHVRIVGEGDGRTRVEIKDRLSKVRGT